MSGAQATIPEMIGSSQNAVSTSSGEMYTNGQEREGEGVNT